ncbi:MAG: group II intron reverse transcriptase/maturase [Symploca sp. SIO2B6]|nr:group II intron reverse transcriptase/maturase [Symploca sp. SIO2B6]
MTVKNQSTNEVSSVDLLPKPDQKRVLKVALNRWKEIPWQKLERKVWKLQKRIYQASRRIAELLQETETTKRELSKAQRNKYEKRVNYAARIPILSEKLNQLESEKVEAIKRLRMLQRLLMKSRAAKLLAVRRVTQENKGKKTAGVDGVKALTPRQRLELVNELRIDGKAMPTRRVWIPKPGRSEKRPLGIPVMKDRAKQKLIELALDPEWEAIFEPNSYGFRKGRSCHDAIKAIWDNICFKPKWVLDADIAHCFDRISHKALLEKLNTTPAIRHQIKAWLRGGVLDCMKYFDTSEGTPQGGLISPLLANIALHGMENRIKQAFPRKQKLVDGKYAGWNKTPRLIRYADDLVVIHEEFEVIVQAQKIIAEWLNDIGLELKAEKTRITHTLDGGKDYQTGFNFLGVNIRQVRVGKNQEGFSKQKKVKRHERLGYHFHTLMTPTPEKVKVHLRKLHRLILVGKSKTLPQSALIKNLNPVIRGWANYYNTVNSKETFSKLDHLLYKKLWRWAKRRHVSKGQKWIKLRYFPSDKPGEKWDFMPKTRNPKLEKYVNVKVISPMTKDQYVKVKGTRSPYDGGEIYWATRLGKHPELSQRKSKLLKQQKGKCTHCGLYFKHDGEMEVHHKDGCHQNNKWDNLELIHQVCHDRIHDESYYDDGIKESKEERLISESLEIS